MADLPEAEAEAISTPTPIPTPTTADELVKIYVKKGVENQIKLVEEKEIYISKFIEKITSALGDIIEKNPTEMDMWYYDIKTDNASLKVELYNLNLELRDIEPESFALEHTLIQFRLRTENNGYYLSTDERKDARNKIIKYECHLKNLKEKISKIRNQISNCENTINHSEYLDLKIMKVRLNELGYQLKVHEVIECGFFCIPIRKKIVHRLSIIPLQGSVTRITVDKVRGIPNI